MTNGWVLISAVGPDGKRCHMELAVTAAGKEFTCQFYTSVVGEHNIEIVVGEKKLTNFTSTFHAYDSSKIKVVNPSLTSFVGTPVEIEGEK